MAPPLPRLGMLALYVAAPFTSAPVVESVIRPMAERRGFCLVSRWHVGVSGPEKLQTLTGHELNEIAETNDRDLVSADVVLVDIRPTPDGTPPGETWAELRLAIHLGKPVAIVHDDRQRLILSAHRSGVERFRTVTIALAWLRERWGWLQETDEAAAHERARRECAP